ncbi:class I SAM-dependent DNA methyltransferase, partial [Salmonella enterica subsp. enterica serovar Derby]
NSMKIINPTLHANPGDVARLPYAEIDSSKAKNIALRAIGISKKDWDSFEVSWNFLCNPLLNHYENNKVSSLKKSFEFYNDYSEKMTDELIEIEADNNKLVNNAFGFENLPSKQLREDITLNRNIHFRYPSNEHYDLKKMKYRSETLSDFISYCIGCQMGRYSLDREGLVYAHEGNKGFAELVAEGAYKTFPADNDGILPLMDDEWFDDDVTSRVKEFVRTVWGEEHLQENLEFIAESLCLYAIKPKKGESALDTIRRYLSTQFWKDHMKMYKKRPIYWLFSSGKEKAFECLVYLHRYNDATLARMRTEYVVPLLARYQANIDRLNEQVDGASGGEATRLKRERDSLSKKFNELRSFDDRLRHYADMRISIDLDDGVKVNYGKFGDLLADVKAITGNAPEMI